ncbi:hypothetical protein KSP40_PGU009364 [Platanthera guangdongensis]|uniref:Uncharacterized protein n=1 Tax=Platanthera guangdongensis TaxID=2320717 RepID=A0ABR2LS35_9ASPA
MYNRAEILKSSISIYLSHFLSVTFSPPPPQRCHLTVSSSKSSSSLLEDAPSNLNQLQIPPLSDTQISSEFISTLCRNPQTQALAFPYYQKALSQPGFQLEPETENGAQSQPYQKISFCSTASRITPHAKN